MPGSTGATVVTNSCALSFLHARLRVRTGTRHSPRPLSWARRFGHSPGALHVAGCASVRLFENCVQAMLRCELPYSIGPTDSSCPGLSRASTSLFRLPRRRWPDKPGYDGGDVKCESPCRKRGEVKSRHLQLLLPSPRRLAPTRWLGRDDERGELQSHRLNNCRSTSFIGWLSCWSCGAGSFCAGADWLLGGGAGVGAARPRLWPRP